jgi:magnesium chelatase subunit H
VRCPELEIFVFSDRDITANPDAVAGALKDADFFSQA